MSWRVRTWWLFVPVVILAIGGAWWLRGQATRAKRLASPTLARREHRPIPVRTVLVSSTDVPAVVGATAVTVPSKQTTIRVASSPRFKELTPVIRTVHVENADYVASGTVLIEFDTALFELTVKEKVETLEAAKATLALAEAFRGENVETRKIEFGSAVRELEYRHADDDFAHSDMERLERLYSAKQANLNEFLKAAATYAEARYTLSRAVVRERIAEAEMKLGPLRDQDACERAEQRVVAATKDHSLALADLDQCQVRSPLNGFIENLTVVTGQRVPAASIVCSVLRIDPIHLTVDFPQERIDRVRVGHPVRVVFDSFPQDAFDGQVVRVPARADAQRRVLPVIVEVPNPNHRIKAGVSAYVRVEVPTAVATVPAVGVTRIGEMASMFVVEDGRAHIRLLKTGSIVNENLLEVREGLEVGDEVVVFGHQNLQDNDAVDTAWHRWARRD